MFSSSTNCPGGILGEIIRQTVLKDGTATAKQIEQNRRDVEEWEAAGIKPGQMATRLASGKLVLEGCAEHLQQMREQLDMFIPTTPNGAAT